MPEGFGDLRFVQRPAAELSPQNWKEIVTLNGEALTEAYRTEPQFLASLRVQKDAGLDNVADYQRRMTHPTTEDSDHKQQRLQDPWITMAYDGGRLLTAVATVNNTSGPEMDARMEARYGLAKWLKIGWIAARPEVQGKGLATTTVAIAIARSNLWQPISAYGYPGDRSHRLLTSFGLKSGIEANPIPKDLKPEDPIAIRHYATGTSKPEILKTALITKSRAKLTRQLNT